MSFHYVNTGHKPKGMPNAALRYFSKSLAKTKADPEALVQRFARCLCESWHGRQGKESEVKASPPKK